MARIYDKKIDKHVKWSGDRNTDFLPVKGDRVEEFIKESLEARIGALYYDTANNRYLAFADNENRDKYLADPTQVQLILGTFDAPFNYSAEINLLTPSYNAVFISDIGNYIDFTFDIKNKQGASTGESVYITYTFIHNATKQVVTETRRFGESVHFNVDKYIKEGTNTIIVGVSGQTTLAATTVVITYQVVNLVLKDELDISKVYMPSNGDEQLEVLWSVEGQGTKVVEWFVDGTQLPFDRVVDEVVSISGGSPKYISLASLGNGVHSLQMRAYTTINGEKFYTDILYRNFFVYDGVDTNTMIGVALNIPKNYDIVSGKNMLVIYDIIQYVPYTFKFATFSPRGEANTNVDIYLGEDKKGSIASKNNVVNEFLFVSNKSGVTDLRLTISNRTLLIPANVAVTNMNLREITAGLAFDFNANGRSNNATDKDTWSFGSYSATFNGFNWNATSGWVKNCLRISNGATFSVNYAPLSGNPVALGRTIEVEFATTNVTNDNTIICDLRENGTGILITATKVLLHSKEGVEIVNEFKENENVRFAFVINRNANSTNKGLAFIYTNGIAARCVNYSISDDFESNTEILFSGSKNAEVLLKAIRVYNQALSSDDILNNFTLYRDNVAEMLDVYDRNNVYEEGTETFSPEKMSNRLPVMIVTGDIPTLENTNDKDTQIIVDIEYINMQDPSKSFTMQNAAMRPQGTSSMGYPKKNFRIYTQKVDNTIVIDAQGNIIEDKLYSFTENAQPVDCWCLKADYAESSGTHNTGIARMWHYILMNTQIDGEYVLRTEAQKKAIAAGYKYDVRTTIDGFPILMFYRRNPTSDLIFIGKYNFNNDKSTESVFGFEGIPDFDNSRMQCWEILNNGNAIALFTDVQDFYNTITIGNDTQEGWKFAFESRYPDTKTPVTDDLFNFAVWMNSVSQDAFATEKWQHMDVYKMAAYYCYLMRFAGADQFVKNAMLTSEDGEHFFFILYDNDTINGLINTGRLAINPSDNRQTKDATGEYVFAGHDSVLWNRLEADSEFMAIVSQVDDAMFSAGLSYDNAIHYFDELQAEKWVERVYNQDAQYKYINPYVESGTNNLFMLQGDRSIHRKWFLAKRFALYDSLFVSGAYKSQSMEFKCINNTEKGQTFAITSGNDMGYGYGINDVPREVGIFLLNNQSYSFVTKETVNLGDPIRVYAAPNIKGLDFSLMTNRLATIDITKVYSESLGTKLISLIIGNASGNNTSLTTISGLNVASKLEVLDIQGCKGLTSIDLSNQPYLKTLRAKGSSIASVQFAKGAPLTQLGLPDTVKSLVLEDLPQLEFSGITFNNFYSTNSIKIINCPKLLNDFYLAYEWYINKTVPNDQSSLHLEGIDWECSASEFINLCNIKKDGGSLVLKGKVIIGELSYEEATKLMDLFGDTVFSPSSELFINAPSALFIVGETSVLEGASTKYSLIAIGKDLANTTWSVTPSNKYVSISNDGVLTTLEGLGVTNLIVAVRATTTEDEVLIASVDVKTMSRTYPGSSNISIVGPQILNNGSTEYRVVSNAEYNGTMNYSWAITGSLANYVTLEPTDDVCIVNLTNNNITTKVNGEISVTLSKRHNGQSLFKKTMSISAVNEDIAETDPTVCSLLYNAGFTTDSTYITKQEAGAITQSMFDTITFKAKGIKSFDGFKYFTKITSLKSTCFNSCTSLKTITLPDSITSLGIGCFDNCYALTSVNIPVGVTLLPSSCFNGCSALTSINIPEGVTSLDSSCFYACAALTSITLPDSVTSLGDHCFNGCFRLTSINIPEGVTSFGQSCFVGCSALSSINIPESVTTLGGSCFSSCGNLIISVDANNKCYSSIDGVLFNKDATALISYAKDKKVPQYTIPSSVTSLYEYCFYGCSAINSITIPNSITSLPSSCFRNCKSLPSITIPNSITSLGTFCFSGCTSLTSINIPEGVTGLPNSCFNGCSALTSITIPEGITNIGTECFSNCTSLTSINIPIGVTVLSNVCFNKCTSLTSITLPASLTKIGGSCFSDCSALASIDIPEGVTSLDDHCFNNCTSLTSITIPDGVTSIPNNCFYNCRALTSVTLPKGLTTLGNSCFNGCESLPTIIIPDSIKTLPDSCFRSCTSLTSITLPESVSTIKSYCFQDCSALTSISIPEKVSTMGTYSFKGCTALTSVTITGNRITQLLESCFYDCTSLTSITLPESVKTLGNYCFRGCTSLSSINLPSGLTKISNYCFSGCTSLTSITLPEGVDRLYDGCFFGCTSLISITIHSNVTHLGGSCFSGCTSLTSITIPSNVTHLGDSCFCGCSALISVDILGSPTVLDNSTFQDCTSLTSITIPNSVTCLGMYCFQNCTSLTSITIPSNTYQLGMYCFRSCRALKEIRCLRATAPSVGSYAFGTNTSEYTGRNTYDTGGNVLYVPQGATGYDKSYWLDPLQNANKCGFTLSATL